MLSLLIPSPMPSPSLSPGVESCCYSNFLSPPPPPRWLRAYSKAVSQGPGDAPDPWAMSQYTVQAQYSLSTSRTIVPPNDKAGNSNLRCHSQAFEALLCGVAGSGVTLTRSRIRHTCLPQPPG